MKYYNEQGEQLTEMPDLTKGYFEPREYIYHEATPAITHKEVKELTGGTQLTYTVVDVPAQPESRELISQTYYRYVDHPTLEMRVAVAEEAIIDIASEVYNG